MTIEDCKPGQRVRVVQTIERRDGDWRCQTVGTIQSIELQKTGSWYAHGRDHKLWLRRLRLIKDDGEITVLNIDRFTQIELLEDPQPVH